MAKYDIHISGIEGGSSRYICGFVNQRAEGFQITMDAYMRCLLTPLGSNPFDPNYGTRFAELPGSNMGGRLDLVRSITFESVENAASTIKRYQRTNNLPSSERLLSAAVSTYNEVGTSGIEVSVIIKNQAGQRMLAVLPHVEL